MNSESFRRDGRGSFRQTWLRAVVEPPRTDGCPPESTMSTRWCVPSKQGDSRGVPRGEVLRLEAARLFESLRLEVGGVLISWPSSARRLAPALSLLERRADRSRRWVLQRTYIRRSVRLATCPRVRCPTAPHPLRESRDTSSLGCTNGTGSLGSAPVLADSVRPRTKKTARPAEKPCGFRPDQLR
jgi:hypothetical protein